MKKERFETNCVLHMFIQQQSGLSPKCVTPINFHLKCINNFPIISFSFLFFFCSTATASPMVRVENLPCTLYNKVCQANVILTRRLVPGRLHDFAVRVTDTKGNSNSMQATISVTNATTPRDKIFAHIPSLIMVPEVSLFMNLKKEFFKLFLFFASSTVFFCAFEKILFQYFFYISSHHVFERSTGGSNNN